MFSCRSISLGLAISLASAVVSATERPVVVELFSHGSEVLISVGPRQQLIDIAVGVTIDDAREDVGQIRERVDVVQLAGLD